MKDKRFLTSKETAEYLDIPMQTLNQLCCQRKITYYRAGKRRYFDISDIHEYIMRQRIPAGSSKKRIDAVGKRVKANQAATEETETNQ